MLISIGVVSGATAGLCEATGVSAQSIDGAPPWIRAMAGVAMLAIGAYFGVLLARPFLAPAKEVGLVSVTTSIVVGAAFVVPTVRALLAAQQSSLALAALLCGMWCICFAATLLRISIWR
jgi:hypothetical protein